MATVFVRGREGVTVNFRSLVSPEVWRDLIERGHRRTYRNQAMLLAQGESPAGVIALVDGLVKVVQGNQSGDRELIPTWLGGWAVVS